MACIWQIGGLLMCRMLFLIYVCIAQCCSSLAAYELGIVSMFKNEAAYLKEWVEYHRLVGVEHFWLYDNESDDNWEEVLQPYIQEGLVEVMHWPLIADSIWYVPTQIAAFKDGLYRAKGRAKWVAVIDIDEFVVPMKESSLTDCINKHFSGASAIYASWLHFGTGGVSLSVGEPILCRLTASSHIKYSKNRVGKSIVRPEDISIEETWYPHHFVLHPHAYYVNGNNEKLKLKEDGKSPVIDRRHHGKYMRINHYKLRDENFFHNVRMARCDQQGKIALLKEYKDFSLDQDFKIVDLIREHYPFMYRGFWNGK